MKRLVAAGESDSLELKKSTGELREGLEALCGFLNSRGGTVVFGVTPRGEIVGQQVTDGTLHDITSAIRNIEPAPRVEVNRVDVGANRSVIVLQTAESKAGPYAFDGRPFVRLGNTTRRMKREEYEHLLLSRMHSKHRWENLPAVGWTIKDLDADEIRQTVVEGVAAKRLSAVPSEKPEVILGRLGLLVDGQLTQAAVVLFGKEPKLFPDYPQCAIRLARFRGLTKSEFADNRQFRGHAFALLRHADAFFDTHLPIASRIVPGRMRREDRPLYPPEALREAVINALCHRDYSEPGVSVGIAIFDDRLEVWSWGRLPGDLTPEKLRVPHPSIRRNELVAETIYRRGYIEKWGRGTQKIIQLCRDSKLPEPDFLERAGEVGVRFWSASAAIGSESALPHLHREVLKALAFLEEASLEEILGRLESPPSSRMIQRTLTSLVDERRVLRIGGGRSTRYRLA